MGRLATWSGALRPCGKNMGLQPSCNTWPHAQVKAHVDASHASREALMFLYVQA